MRYRNSILILTCACLAGIGCQSRASDSAVAASLVSFTIPVGPLPGPAQAAPPPANPYAQDRVALAEGRRLFVQYNCYGCHGGHAGGGMGPSLRDPVWIYGGDDARVFASIAQGRGKGMPAWGTKLPQDQMWKLTAYIKSLRTPLEPDPPE